jgi:hypothetical protein
MIALTDLSGFSEDLDGADYHQRGNPLFSALEAAIIERAEAMVIPSQSEDPKGFVIWTTAAEFLKDVADEAVSPSVRRFGKDIDPVQERFKHLRELGAMCSAGIFEATCAEAYITADDPRREKVKVVADRIEAIILEALESAIESVAIEAAPKSTVTSTPKL